MHNRPRWPSFEKSIWPLLYGFVRVLAFTKSCGNEFSNLIMHSIEEHILWYFKSPLHLFTSYDWITISSHAVYPFTMPLMTWSTLSTATCLFLLWSVSLMWSSSIPMVTIFTLCITFLIPFYTFFFFCDRTLRTSLSKWNNYKLIQRHKENIFGKS